MIHQRNTDWNRYCQWQTQKSELTYWNEIPELIMQIEGETEPSYQLEQAMSATVSEIEVINPMSLDKAKTKARLAQMDHCNTGRAKYSK